MITQNDIFALYTKMANETNYSRTGSFDLDELATRYPDEEVIEMIIAMYGSSSVAWDYGHWMGWRDKLIEIYGSKLIPYLELRIQQPLHGGGVAYGEEYLSKSGQRVQAFCQSALNILLSKSGEVKE